MRRAKTWIVIIACGLCAAACSGGPQGGTEVENPDVDIAQAGSYLNKAAGVRIDFPAGWTCDGESDTEATCSPTAQVGQDVVNVTFEDSPDGIDAGTLSGFVGASRPGVAFSTYNAAGFDGGVISEEQSFDGTPKKMREGFLLANQKLTHVVFVYLTDDVSDDLVFSAWKINAQLFKDFREEQQEQRRRMLDSSPVGAQAEKILNVMKKLGPTMIDAEKKEAGVPIAPSHAAMEAIEQQKIEVLKPAMNSIPQERLNALKEALPSE